MNLLSHRTRLPAKAYGAEPLSVAELDAHPDSARLWATIRVIREEYTRKHNPSAPERWEAGS